MIRLAVRELVSRRTATALAVLGLLTATLGYVILTTTSQTTAAVLRGDIGQAWNTSYDILVRPRDTSTSLELKAVATVVIPVRSRLGPVPATVATWVGCPGVQLAHRR